jgi:hypothetical protein
VPELLNVVTELALPQEALVPSEVITCPEVPAPPLIEIALPVPPPIIIAIFK